MHILITRYPTIALAEAGVFLISAETMEVTDVQSAVSDYRMAKLSLHRTGYCPRSTMPDCAFVLPDEKPDKIIKESKIQRARRNVLKTIHANQNQG